MKESRLPTLFSCVNKQSKHDHYIFRKDLEIKMIRNKIELLNSIKSLVIRIKYKNNLLNCCIILN